MVCNGCGITYVFLATDKIAAEWEWFRNVARAQLLTDSISSNETSDIYGEWREPEEPGEKPNQHEKQQAGCAATIKEIGRGSPRSSATIKNADKQQARE